MNRALSLLTNLFPVWVLSGGALALVRPAWFLWFSGDFITWGLAITLIFASIIGAGAKDFKQSGGELMLAGIGRLYPARKPVDGRSSAW